MSSSSKISLSEKSRARLRDKLLAWYDVHKRDLPWRKSRDPYRIWVSEIMLQQTRVDTVIPYFERFLKRYPTINALADASTDDVLAMWSGLGYYRRARLLVRGVREAVEGYGGVPNTAAQLQSLAGVGRYTAGAIGSIAFDLEEPLVDGNVARVLSRVFTIEAALGTKESDSALWAHAAELVRGKRPGDFNQALMELGATVCSPTSPSCEKCPLAFECAAKAAGRQESLPLPKTKKAPKAVNLVALAIVSGEKIALKKGENELFSGLYNVPSEEGEGRAVAENLLRCEGVKAKLEQSSRGSFTHVLTHRRLFVEVWVAHVTAANAARVAMYSRDERTKLGIAKLSEKIFAIAFDDQALSSRAKTARKKSPTTPSSKSSPKLRAKNKTSTRGRGSSI